MQKININYAFQLVFFTVVGFTLISGTTSLCLAFQEDLSPEQNRVFESSITTWQMGVGAVFGLLGSKATELFDEEDDEE